MSCNIVENFRHFIRQMKVQEEGCKGETGTVRPATAGLQTNNCFQLLATGGSPGVIQRSRACGIGCQRRNTKHILHKTHKIHENE